MLPYIFLLFVPIVIQHIKVKGIEYSEKNQFALTLFFVFLTLLVMFRHECVGNDTRNYIYYFKKYAEMEWLAPINLTSEIGFLYFNKIVAIFSSAPQVFLAVAAIVVSGLMFPTYKRLNLDAALTIVLFCTMSTFVMMFSGIRQMLAIGTGFVAYEYTRKKKLVYFFVSVMIAVSFHTSAFMLLFMYPLYHARITRRWLYVVVPVMAALFLFNKQVFVVLTGILSRFSRFDGSMTSTGAYAMLILFTAFTVFSFLIPDEKMLDDEIIGLRNFLLLALVIQMFAPLHSLAMRMNYYYIIFLPLLMPKIIAIRSKRWSQLAIVGRHIMVGFFLLYFFVVVYRSGALHVFPYHFFWESI